MNFVNPGLLGSQAYFKRHFLYPIERDGDEAKKEKLYYLIKPFVLRRNKAQVAKDLPEKIEQTIYCDMSELQAKVYEEEKSKYRNEILQRLEKDGLGKTQFLLLQGLTRLRQIANHPRLAFPDYEGNSGKLEEVLDKLAMIVQEGAKVLVFSQFVSHLKIVKDYLDLVEWNYAYLDGATKDRQAEVERFQNDENVKVFLISLKAGGLGLNLTAAEYVLLLDPWWNPAVEAQAIDRAHRIGQKNTVITYRFISKNTVEEKILALQRSKRQLAEELITVEEGFMKSLSSEDIMMLLN
jgi:SNF2 family DNA or RNA helicase